MKGNESRIAMRSEMTARTFTFDKVFDESFGQSKVFEDLRIGFLIQKILQVIVPYRERNFEFSVFLDGRGIMRLFWLMARLELGRLTRWKGTTTLWTQ